MTRQNRSHRREPGTMAFLALAIALVLGAMAAIPASGMATTRFGAKLSGDLDPVEDQELCPDNGGVCTRVPLRYENPTHAGPSPYAPRDGVIDKIRLVSSTGASFVPQVVKVKGNIAPITEVKVKAEGPFIGYEGTGEIESFDVDIPVKQGQRIAMRTTFAGALQCEPGIDNEAIVDPTILPSMVFTDANYYTGCTHLLQAVMED
jgi:hypothetical protein